MIGNAFCNLWRAAITLLLLLTIGTIASQPTDFDLDIHPAPFSAYDDDVVRTSVGPGHNGLDIKAVQDAAGNNGKLPPPGQAIHLPDVQFQLASAASSTWFRSSAGKSLLGATRAPYLARGPPTA